LCSGAWTKFAHVTRGGVTRQESVQCGVAVVSAHVGMVVIHDAARPLVTSAMFTTVIEAAAQTGAAITAVPVVDTLKHVVDGFVSATAPREGMWAAQTPQAFSIANLHLGFDAISASAMQVTDEAMLFEYLRLPVAVVPGSRDNLKVTYPGDLAVAEFLLAKRESTGGQDR